MAVIDPRGTTITIRVQLPQELGKVGELLEVVGTLWPDVVVDTADGWTIDVPPDDPRLPRSKPPQVGMKRIRQVTDG